MEIDDLWRLATSLWLHRLTLAMCHPTGRAYRDLLRQPPVQLCPAVQRNTDDERNTEKRPVVTPTTEPVKATRPLAIPRRPKTVNNVGTPSSARM